MRLSRNRLFRFLSKTLKTPVDRTKDGVELSQKTAPKIPATSLRDPVYEYYKYKFDADPKAFTRFGLQSQSIIIRDQLAKISTYGREEFRGLLNWIQTALRQKERDLGENEPHFYKEALLALADLLSNTARDDLETHAAMQIYEFTFRMYGSDSLGRLQRLQYLEVLSELGEYEAVERYSELFQIHLLAPLQYELLAAQRVRIELGEDAWLAAMNDLYSSLGLSRIQLSPDSSRALLDRLESSPVETVDGPKVSVIMPTYAPGPGIWTAVRSLLQQSWRNLEVIVVDDASPSEYGRIFSDLEAMDERIRVVRLSQNSGAYVARNMGLGRSTGEYVTTHDDDDWSHPDKIATQVKALIEDQDVVASTSSHIRASPDMKFKRVNREPVYLQKNYSSLMFRTGLVDDIGPWDSVNRSGDAEFLMRITSNYGAASIVDVANRPLSFSRVWSGSLTSGEMARGYHGHSRILYRWAFRQWQIRSVKTEGKAELDADRSRQFPIPTTFAPGARRQNLGLFDVIYVTDYSRQAKLVNFVLEEIDTLSSRGYRVGFMHLDSPQTSAPAGLPQQLLDLQLNGLVTQVSHEDVAETRLLLVYDASIGMFLDEVKSKVTCRRCVVVDHELPSLSGGPKRISTNILQALHHLDECFGSRFEIVGGTYKDQIRLRTEAPLDRLLPEETIWNPHIRQSASEISAPGVHPIVGFHSYGNVYRWPTDSSTFKSVYVSQYYETHFYGSTSPAKKKFGDLLQDNTSIIAIDDREERSFLEQVDFWVYYPHNRLNDQVWRPVLSAMQAGKVVILPKSLEAIYGPSALYSEPEDVEQTIKNLAQDAEAYKKQARQGQLFVSRRFTEKQVQSRLTGLIESV